MLGSAPSKRQLAIKYTRPALVFIPSLVHDTSQDGSTFKSVVVHQPYFYLGLSDGR